MKPTYHSILICTHPSRTEVYLNGRTLGIITPGDQALVETADTQSLPTINAMQPHPFHHHGEVADHLHSIAAAIARYAAELAAKAKVAATVDTSPSP